MTVAPSKPEVFTEAEYLALEVESDIRSEYRDGEIIPMTGGTPEHNQIAGNLFAMLKFALKGKPYTTFVIDQRLWIPQANTHTYPDVMVLSQPISLKEGRTDTVVNPIFIAEVLSRSIQNYDWGDKFAIYRTLPTLQAYLLIDQYRVGVELYAKQAENQWLLTEYKNLQDEVSLASLPVSLTLSDIYEDMLKD